MSRLTRQRGSHGVDASGADSIHDATGSPCPAQSTLLPPPGRVPQHTTEVLEGLKFHAPKADRAVRSSELARKLGLGSTIVARALEWLAAEPAHRVVRRRKSRKEIWDKFSFEP